MEYAVLSNGVKMPILGYGVYQVTKDECERCVLDALQTGYGRMVCPYCGRAQEKSRYLQGKEKLVIILKG